MKATWYFVGPVRLVKGFNLSGYMATCHRLARTEGGEPIAWQVDLWGLSLGPDSPMRWCKSWRGQLNRCIAEATSYVFCLANDQALRYDGEEGDGGGA